MKLNTVPIENEPNISKIICNYCSNDFEWKFTIENDGYIIVLYFCQKCYKKCINIPIQRETTDE